MAPGFARRPLTALLRVHLLRSSHESTQNSHDRSHRDPPRFGVVCRPAQSGRWCRGASRAPRRRFAAGRPCRAARADEPCAWASGSTYPRPGYPGGHYGYGHHYSGYPYTTATRASTTAIQGSRSRSALASGTPTGMRIPFPTPTPTWLPLWLRPWYGYGYPGYVAVVPGAGYGGVRIAVDQRDAEVFVDGHYMGVVDDFDGTFQQVNLEPGPHRVDVRRDGFEPVTVNVNIQPGRTVTYRTPLRQAP